MLDDEYTVESIPQSIYTDEEHNIDYDNKNEQSYTGTGLTDRTELRLQEGEGETHRKASFYRVSQTSDGVPTFVFAKGRGNTVYSQAREQSAPCHFVGDKFCVLSRGAPHGGQTVSGKNQPAGHKGILRVLLTCNVLVYLVGTQYNL